jgi:hypothetical protein
MRRQTAQKLATPWVARLLPVTVLREFLQSKETGYPVPSGEEPGIQPIPAAFYKCQLQK